MADYPNWAGNPQNTLADGAADPLSAQGLDYNKLDDEIVASQADLKGAMAAAGGAGSMTAAMAAAYTGTVNSPDDLTDRTIWLPPAAWEKDSSGLWSIGFKDSLFTWLRSASASDNGLLTRLPMGRSTALRGLRLDTAYLIYHIGVATLDDVQLLVKSFTIPANGAPPAGVSGALGTYDANHNTPAKRKTVGYHTMELTVTAVIGDNGWDVSLFIDADAGAAAVFSLFGCLLTLTDLAR